MCDNKSIVRHCMNKENNTHEKIAVQILNRYIERFEGLQGLTEIQSAIRGFTPSNLLEKLTHIVQDFYDGNSELYISSIPANGINIDGFINFRLGSLKTELDDYINSAITLCVSRNKYFYLLDSIKNYVNNMPEIIDELYISSLSDDTDDAGILLNLILELLPHKIFVYSNIIEQNPNFIDSLQYVFGDRIILIQKKYS